MTDNNWNYHKKDCKLFAEPFIIEGRHCTCGVESSLTHEIDRLTGLLDEAQGTCTALGETAKNFGEEIYRLLALTGKTYCAYCGAEFPLDDDAASQVSEHIKTCEKHPMRKVEDLLSATELALDASNTHIRQLEREIMELRGTLP